MPIYDYICRRCQHAFETLVRTGFTPACPACQSEDLERQLSAFAVKSAEGTRRAADKKIKTSASAGRQDTAALEREGEQHRKEDH